jgi:hypothetical protein
MVNGFALSRRRIVRRKLQRGWGGWGPTADGKDEDAAAFDGHRLTVEMHDLSYASAQQMAPGRKSFFSFFNAVASSICILCWGWRSNLTNVMLNFTITRQITMYNFERSLGAVCQAEEKQQKSLLVKVHQSLRSLFCLIR